MSTTTSPAVAGRNPTLAAFRTLHESLTMGRWPAGSRLPGERTLAGELGVSRATLRQALLELADVGLLEPSAQRGWFVKRQRISEGPNLLHSFTETARERGLAPGSRVIEQRVRPATLDEAEVLGLAPAAAVVQLDRVRSLDGVPTAVQNTCLSLRYAPSIDTVDFGDRSLYQVLVDDFGLVPTDRKSVV